MRSDRCDSIRAVFFDIDGTIVNSNGLVSAETRTEIEKLLRQGVIVSLATGRPFFAAKELAKDLRISGPSTFFSGSLVSNPIGGDTLYEDPLSADDVAAIAKSLRDEGFYVELYSLDEYFIEEASDFADTHARYLKRLPIIKRFDDVISRYKILKIVLMVNSTDEDRRMRAALQKFSTFSLGFAKGATHPDITFANITSKKASRENAFQVMIRSLGIKASEVVAFGDGEADIPFLKMAGIGIAMGNASDEVKAEAKMVTESVENEGVALALRKLGS